MYTLENDQKEASSNTDRVISAVTGLADTEREKRRRDAATQNHIHIYAGTHIQRYTDTRRHIYVATQRQRETGTHRHIYTGALGRRATDTPIHSGAETHGAQRHRCAYPQRHMGHIFTCTTTPKHRDTETQLQRDT